MTTQEDSIISKVKESLILIEKMEEKAFGLTGDFLKSVSDANVEDAFPLCKSAANVANSRMNMMKSISESLIEYAKSLDNLCVAVDETKKKLSEKPPPPRPKVKFFDEDIELKYQEIEYKENVPKVEEKKPVRLQMPDSPVLQTAVLNSTVLASAKKIQRTMPNTPPTLRKPTIAERLEIKPKVLNFDDSTMF